MIGAKIQVDIIIVNWNGQHYLRQAIEPLISAAASSIAINIIVSDNGSTDNSLTTISDFPVRIIRNGENIGFGAACNKALGACTGKYVLLLNPDTESTIAVLEELVGELEEKPGVAIIGPRQVDEHGKVQRTCGRFPNFLNAIWEITGLSKLLPTVFSPSPIMFDWDHLSSATVNQVMGSYMLIRRSLIDEIGFMDEDFFMYAEDRDFSKRAFDSGYTSYYHSESQVFHASGGLSKKVMAKRLYYSLSSKRCYWKKHLKMSEYYVLLILALSIEPTLRLLRAIFSFKKDNILQVGKAYQYFYSEVFGKVTPQMVSSIGLNRILQTSGKNPSGAC